MGEEMTTAWGYVSKLRTCMARPDTISKTLLRPVLEGDSDSSLATTSTTTTTTTTTRRSWSRWRRKPQESDDSDNVHVVNVFPGWATRRYVGDAPEFEVEVYVSGFACSRTGKRSRSQRALVRLAKKFARLPEMKVEDLDRYGDDSETSSTCSLSDSHTRLHDNLERRLCSLWDAALPNRTVRLRFLIEDGVLASRDVVTGPDGSFQSTIRFKWEELVRHPLALAETIQDHDLLVLASLLSPGTETLYRIPITHSPIRLISDIDDTVKLSGILSGARAVFHNVFVKDLSDNIIPGMADWYANMFRLGVRFHYVSNGPFAVLPILNDFFRISQLPLGSLKLRSYAGRSIFDGLISAPATRKRAGVLEILNAFPHSLFFLVGDTGEQDLELYAEIARERPRQILGVFLRDARPDPEPLADPTGLKVNERRKRTTTTDSPTTGSLASLLRRFPSYRTKDSAWRTASLPTLAAGQISTPPSPVTKPTRFTVDGTVPISNTPPPDYFGFGPLTLHPEADEYYDYDDDDDVFDSSSPSSLGLTPSFISEPPQPIPSPTITTPSSCSSFSIDDPVALDFYPLLRSSTPSNNTSNSKATLRDQLQKRVYRARKVIPDHIVLRVFATPAECVEVDQILCREGCQSV